MKIPDPEGAPRIDVSWEELEALLEQAKQEPLREEGYHKLKAAIRTLGYVTELLKKKEATLASLRELLCPASTEKTEKVLERAGIDTADKSRARKPSKKPKGAVVGTDAMGGCVSWGHQGARAARVAKGGRFISGCAVQGQSLRAVRSWCAGADQRASAHRRDRVRVGEAAVSSLRESVHGRVSGRRGREEYDDTAASMIALLRYGSGFPWNRLEGLEESLGIPLPAATQCEIVAEIAVPLQPAFEELKRQAAQGDVVHNDDTAMRVLSLDRDADISPERTGVFTSGLVWITKSAGSRCISPGASTPARIWPRC